MNWNDLFRITMPVTALEVTALLVLLVDLSALRNATRNARTTVASLLGVAGCLISLWMTLGLSGSTLSVGNNPVLHFSGIAIVAQVGVLVLTALTLLLFVGADFTRHVGEYVAIVLMAAAGGWLISAAQDLLVIFIGLELLSLGLYALTAFAKSSGKSAEAALKYYLFGGMASAFLLFGFSYLYGLSGNTNLDQIGWLLMQPGQNPLLYIAWILVIAGLGFKIAVVPFHLWAPDAYEGAPAPAAAFIASVSKVASFTLLLTIVMHLSLPYGRLIGNKSAIVDAILQMYKTWNQFAAILLIISAVSMILGNLVALAQISVRRLLAYSAIAHAGYILLGIGAQCAYNGHGNLLDLYKTLVAPGAGSVLYYVLTYGLTTIGAFGVVAVVEKATGSDRMDAFLGLHKRNPLLAAVLLVLFLSLAGIPPLVGFWAKFNLFAAVLRMGNGMVPFALVALAVAMSAVSLYYYLQVLKRAYVMPPTDETPIKACPVTMAVLLLIAVAVVVLGCFPDLLQSWITAMCAIR